VILFSWDQFLLCFDTCSSDIQSIKPCDVFKKVLVQRKKTKQLSNSRSNVDGDGFDRLM